VLPDPVIDASLEILWLKVILRLLVGDKLTVPDTVSLTDELLETSIDVDIDVESEELTDAVGWRVVVKLDVWDKLLENDAEVVIDIVADSEDDAVDDILVLWDAIIVTDPLILCDISLVALGLDEVVADILELELRDIDIVGELDNTEPAPTATNAIFVDCNHDAVMGSVSATV
jgi:hypothetical protein